MIKELLTPRELQVAQEIAKGLTEETIADKLSISRRAIHLHLNRIYYKLRIPKRGQVNPVTAFTTRYVKEYPQEPDWTHEIAPDQDRKRPRNCRSQRIESYDFAAHSA